MLLYEKRVNLPSRWNSDHKRFYDVGRLLQELKESLPFGEWRLRMLHENDQDFDYNTSIHQHSAGCYEIECVVERIKLPNYLYEMLEEFKAETQAG